MPFKALIEQVQRLFSSKKNGGKLVYLLTDRLHYFKVVLLFTSILLLIGYSQFREHFKCDDLEIKDGASMTQFCWLNGTSTVDSRGTNSYRVSPKATHVGLGFLPGRSSGLLNNNGAHQQVRTISHGYMRDYWVLMILMIFCSYVAQRVWSDIFNNDLLKSLLQLPGYNESLLVKSAQEAKPYEKLVSLKNDKKSDELSGISTGSSLKQKSGSLVQLERVFQYLDSITDQENIHNHLLDYYPNQLVYLLITKENSAYKLLSLRLRRKLFLYSVYSTCFSCLQFLMPLLLFGRGYSLYGWKFARLWLRYCLLQLLEPRSDINSMTYKSSHLLWPTVVNCEFRHYGYQGKFESFGVQCIAAINDLCGKMFAVIWWLVVISIVVELYSLFWATCYLLKPEFFLGTRFWPRARHEASLIATFRFRRSKKMAQAEGYCEPEMEESPNKFLSAFEEKKRLSQQLLDNNARRCKTKVGAGVGARGCEKGSGSGEPAAVFWWWRRVYEYLVERSQRRRRSREVERFLSEVYKDLNVYHLFQLLYMRLGRNSRKVEQIIVMCSEALENYLEFWGRFAEIKARLRETLPVERGPSEGAAAAIDASSAGNKGQAKQQTHQSMPENKELLLSPSQLSTIIASQQQQLQNQSKPDTVIDVNLGRHI